MKRLLRGLLASAMLTTTVLSSGPGIVFAADDSGSADTEYEVIEDAYVRAGGNANRNYNYENITKAHGEQYVGKNLKALSTKNNNGSSNEIMTLMKFPIPDAAEIEEKQLDHFELVFHIFKNADYNTGDQTYRFYYSTDTDWSETSVTWNNKPEDVTRDSQQVLFDFDIKQGDEYETKPDAEKEIHMDITETVEALSDQGVKEITVFTAAINSMNTSLMIQDRSSGNASADENGIYAASIVASHEGITLEQLNQLIAECEQLDSSQYEEDSWRAFYEQLSIAKEFAAADPQDSREIRDMYHALEEAKDALITLIDPADPDNVAYRHPVRSNLSSADAEKVNDGDLSTSWSGKFYPSYVDIDLKDTYDISEIIMNFPEGKTLYYTLYGSNDGEHFDEIAQVRSDEAKDAAGDVITPEGDCSYRIIRYYAEYTDGESPTYLSEIKVHGEKSGTNTEALREGTFEEITGIQAFDDTAYAEEISEEETIENVYGIIDRTIGAEYRDWFSFEIAPNTENDNDYFELSDQDGKIHIKGNEGLSLTTGLNYYYKNYVNVQISEETMQNAMPQEIVTINGTVRKETDMQVRYAFNYCTLSYTFAFFGEEEWQRENDWLALNGVNVVLDLAGQEATWIKFLMNFGYSYDDAKDWLTGPGYYAWQFMDNMEVFGGPIPDDYVIDRVELARSTQRWKRSLGMQTVLQGYAGMVPTNFKDYYQNDIEIISQGNWNGFSRPNMIATDSEEYDQFAQLFYEAQEFVYGNTTDYYAVDPFHEGGIRPSGLTDDKISAEVLESMMAYDEDAVWTVQGWQSNPTDALLEGMGDNREDHVLIVDLIKYPITSSGEEQYKEDEFQGTSWAWCLLGNFGGNPTMNGELQTMVDEIMDARKDSQHLAGIGIISEATYDNPMIYDLIFDLAWADEDFDLDQWISDYLIRRYGGQSDNAEQAWELIKNANYDSGVRLTPELFGLRTGGVPKNIGKKDIGYDAEDLENALRLLLEDFDRFSGSEGYLYDLSEIMRQICSNYTVLKYHEVIDARDDKDLEAFRQAKEEFLNAFDVLNEVQKTRQNQLAGEWIGKAQDRAAEYDDFSKSTFEMNAKSLITTWGSSGGSLVDYGFRTYEGMFLDLIKSNWTEYLDQVEQNLIDGTAIDVPSNTRGYIEKYWKWVIGDQDYTRDAADSPEEVLSIAQRVLDECVFTGELDPDIGNIALDREVDIDGNAEGKTSWLTDGETDQQVSVSADQSVTIDLLAEFDLTGLSIVTADPEAQYTLSFSQDGREWNEAQGTLSTDAENGIIRIDDLSVNARYVRVVSDRDVSLSEIRVYGNQMLPTVEQLQRLIETAEQMNVSANPDDLITSFQEALEEARQAAEEASADSMNTAYWNLYGVMIQMDTSGLINVALNKPTTAHNDPSGNSKNVTDGSTSTRWDSGRLSATGKPYEDTITPGWVIIDLEDTYEISEISLSFASSTIWYQYELYCSMDQEEWVKIGEKKTETAPNEQEDTYEFEPQRARYVLMRTTNIQEDSSGKRNGYLVSELSVKGKLASADKSVLSEAIDAAKAIEDEGYTTDSWNALQDALSAAETIMADDHAVQEQIDQAASALDAAMDALQVKASASAIQALQNMVNKANALGSDDEALNSAIETAQALLDDPDNASATAVVSALLNLSEAMQALNTDESTDALREDVQATIDFINEHILNDVEGLRPGKVQALRDAVKAAQDVVDDPDATADELKAANKAMTKAAQELWEIVTKAELNALIEAANGYLDGDYTTESLEALQTAITAAQAVANNDDATTAEVTDAITNLANAIAGLETIALDTSALEHEIELVSEMVANIGNYVPSTVEGLQDKLDAAKTVLGNATTQAEIDAATESLREARLNARTKADVSALEELIAYVNSLDLRAYTLDSVVPVNRMMSKLTQAMNDEEITQEKVDELAAEMQAAIDGLQPNVTPETGDTANGSTDTGSANTAAAMQTGMFAGLLAASAGLVFMMRRRRQER